MITILQVDKNYFKNSNYIFLKKNIDKMNKNKNKMKFNDCR